MSLLDLQRDFGAVLRTEPDECGHAGIRVHQNNYRGSLLACLDDSFARTRDWIGGDAFREAARHHIERVPPSSWTLDAYPRDFPDTLRLQYPDDPEIAELAWLELALAEAFVGPDAEPLSAADAANVDWDRAVLQFTPTLDICRFTTNACALWSAMTAGERPSAVVLLDVPEIVLVWRYEQISCFRPIDAQEEWAILQARAGTPFTDLCAALVDLHGGEDGVAVAGRLLGRWLADGLLTGITGTERNESR